MGKPLSEIGREVVETSRETGGRGIVAQLFPYIFEAEKRMSARAIGREFEKRGVKISQGSISKALREPERHFEAHFDYVEPAARTIARKLGCARAYLLTDWTSFQEAEAQFEKGHYEPGEGQRLHDAFSVLRDDWWRLGDDFREFCLKHGELPGEDEGDSGPE